MERLAKRFSLQLYEEFEIAEIPYIRYRFSSKSLELYCCNKKLIPALETLYKLLTHQYHIESLTEFVEGDRYYIPCPTSIEMWDYDTWSEREVDYYRLNRGFACKTRERAVAMSQEMLKDIQVREE